MREARRRKRFGPPRLLAAAVGSAIALAPAAPLGADTVVRLQGGRLDVTATSAPIAEVLDRIARQTGMKVVYDGPPPRNTVNLQIQKATAVQAVLGALEGLGLAYAVRLDPTGTAVETLLMVTAKTGGTPAAASAQTRFNRPREEQAPDMVEEVEADDQPVEAPPPETAPQRPPNLPPGFPNLPFSQGAPAGAFPPGMVPPGLPPGFPIPQPLTGPQPVTPASPPPSVPN